jgi:hypothetical protein
MGWVWARAVQSRWSAAAGGYLVAVLETAAVLFGCPLDPWLDYDQPLAALSGSVAVAVWYGGYDSALSLLPSAPLPATRCKEVFEVVFDLSPGDVIRFGDDVTLTVLAVEDDLVRVRLERLAGECPGAGMDCAGADRKPQRAGRELS